MCREGFQSWGGCEGKEKISGEGSAQTRRNESFVVISKGGDCFQLGIPDGL